MSAFNNKWTGHLKGVVQTIHRYWVDGAYNLQNSIKVIELLKHLQDLNNTREYSNPLVHVFSLDYTSEWQREKQRIKTLTEFKTLRLEITFFCEIKYVVLIMEMMQLAKG